eukprot:m.484086 g.484086  ORF g.484086 m.484086 type:complete len:295 (-) comp23186_c0_seq1:281-1165(-)
MASTLMAPRCALVVLVACCFARFGVGSSFDEGNDVAPVSDVSDASSGGKKTFECDQDTYFCEDATGLLANGAGSVLFAGRTRTGMLRRALVRFDLSKHGIPADGKVTEVKVSLHVTKVPPLDPEETVTLHRVTSQWTTGHSNVSTGSCANATRNDATWVYAQYPSRRWSSLGGDFEAEPSASAPVHDLGRYNFSSDQLLNDVQDWLDGKRENFGWIIRGDEQHNETAKEIGSRETNMEPALHVEWKMPDKRKSGGRNHDLEIALPVVFVVLLLGAVGLFLYRRSNRAKYNALQG